MAFVFVETVLQFY